MVGIAHAQTATGTSQLTPAETAALEQQLSVAKAQLVNLEMQAGMIPSGDSGSSAIPAANQPAGTGAAPSAAAPSVSNGLTSVQVSAMNSALGTLSTMLSQLSASVAAETSLTATQQSQVAATLGSMKDTLVAIAGTINGAATPGVQNSGTAVSGASAPIAQQSVGTPSVNSGSAVAANTGPSVSVNVNPTPATQPVQSAQPPPQASANPASGAQTAQVSSVWSFTKDHWPTIVIVLLVIAILAILFWPEKKEPVKTVSSGGNAGSGKPKAAPILAPSPANLSANVQQSNNSNNGGTALPKTATPAPATPVASAVAAPAHK